MPEVPFTTGTSIERIEIPIIGPPEITFIGSSLNPPQKLISSRIERPNGTCTFLGSAIASPVTVTTRSRTGRPFSIASHICQTVLALRTMHPTSAGRAGTNGTSLPVTDNMSIFSAPCGYLTLTGITRIRGFLQCSVIVAMASGLLLSIAITPSASVKTSSTNSSPRMISSGRSSISLLSQFRNGSHSAALIMM